MKQELIDRVCDALLQERLDRLDIEDIDVQLTKSSRDLLLEEIRQDAVTAIESAFDDPVIDDFIEGLRIEIPYQQHVWNVEDAGKSISCWIRLIHHLTAKIGESDWNHKPDKAKHHIITTAAALANFHAAMNEK
jgi:hypothetical protein